MERKAEKVNQTQDRAGRMKDEDKKSPEEIAAENWARYEYGISRGHRDYTETAKVLEGFYLGGSYDSQSVLQAGGQWNQDDLDDLADEGRPAYEINEIKPALDAAIGYQIANRMDISFKPRSGDATKELAEVRSKVAMQIADNNQLHWLETEVFSDGMVQRRGFFDIRMSFEDSMIGELRLTSLDPLDVIPDPDAKSYDPKYWGDVIVTRFLSLDEIEDLYGVDAKKIAEESSDGFTDDEFGNDADGATRNTFGSEERFDASFTSGKVRRWRIIDRQQWIRKLMDVAVYPSGDIRPLTGDETPEQMAQMEQRGVSVTKRAMKRVRWTVSTVDTLLHDDWSPYDRLTIVPYFPYFRRGKTRGMVDNAVGPQQILNKSISQAIHIINTTANSGWQQEEDQLIGMTTAELSRRGAETGLVITRKKGTQPLVKITSNPMPQGMDRLITLSNQAVQDVTVPDALRGVIEGVESGIAVQSRQHASQQILAVPLDNLARTRNLLASWIDYAISKYYDSERIFRITKSDPATGREEDEMLEVNKLDPETGTYINDLTAGEYDVVITEQPMQVTFENSQFEQVVAMRKEGIAIPDVVIVKHSNLSDKADVIAMMENASKPSDPAMEAKVRLIDAQTEKTKAEAVNKSVEGMYSATQAAQQIAIIPDLAQAADEMLMSAGFVDKNAAPIMPNMAGVAPVVDPNQGQPPVQPTVTTGSAFAPENTNPLTPANPGVGVNAGIEKMGPEGAAI